MCRLRRSVEVVLCPGAKSDADKLACWAAAGASVSSCNADDMWQCGFAYTSDGTPAVGGPAGLMTRCMRLPRPSPGAQQLHAGC